MTAEAFDLKAFLRSAYWFGAVDQGVLGAMSFAPTGKVMGRVHPNEDRYKITPEGELTFLSRQGQVTSVLRFVPQTGGFVPQQGYPHFLQPIFALNPAQPVRGRPPVFVNTVPKAGTYLMARALENAGFTNQGLHVMDGFFHDNRGVAEDDIHWDPSARQRNCPAGVVAGLLQGGEFVVGHCDVPGAIAEIAQTGVTLVHLIREPRDMLASMFAFKTAKVKPQPADRLWQSMEGPAAFKAFLLSHPVAQWVAQTHLMAGQPGVLRFEDLKAGQIARKAMGYRLSRQVEKGLKEAIGTTTATYIPADRGAVRAYADDPDVVTYLEETGVMELSRKFWPESHRASSPKA